MSSTAPASPFDAEEIPDGEIDMSTETATGPVPASNAAGSWWSSRPDPWGSGTPTGYAGPTATGNDAPPATGSDAPTATGSDAPTATRAGEPIDPFAAGRWTPACAGLERAQTLERALARPARFPRLMAVAVAAGLVAGGVGGAGAATLLNSAASAPSVATVAGSATTGSAASGSAGATSGQQGGGSSGTPSSPVTGSLDARKVAAAVLPSVVSVSTVTFGGQGTGAGWVFDNAGHIVTNAHVVDGAQQVQVVTNDGRRLSATIVGTDPSNDVAVLRVENASGLTPLPRGRSTDVAVGDEVLAVGSPLGLAGTVTSGIVSAKDRDVQVGDGGSSKALQTDASINPGNSGGPLVNGAGQVIGMNSAIATLGSQRAGSIGIGFAIPIDRVATVAQRLIGGRP